MPVASAQSNGSGDFDVLLPEGEYLIEITKSGYIPFSIYQRVENDPGSTQMQTIELIPGRGMGGFRGVITDAVTGLPIEGVTLKLRSGWDNSDQGAVIKTLTTNANGEFRYNAFKLPLTNLVLGLPCGNYSLTASKNGYIGSTFNIVALPGETSANPPQDVTMAPAQTQRDTWRIVLTWGEDPSDLDSHVVGALTSGNSFHVYYGDKSQYDGDLEVCNLDLDDTTSYGPETITLNTNNSAPYYYYVHRYAGDGTVSSSGAQIRVYHGADMVRTFNVPTGQGNGDYWNVFAVVNGQIVVRNTITDGADIGYAGAPGIMTASLDEVVDKASIPSTDRNFTATAASGRNVSAAALDEAASQAGGGAAAHAGRTAMDAPISGYKSPEIAGSQTAEREPDRAGSSNAILLSEPDLEETVPPAA